MHAHCFMTNAGGLLPCCWSQVGDVIYIEANSGAVKRVGRCDAYATEFDLEAEEYVPLPKVGARWQHCVAQSRVGPGVSAVNTFCIVRHSRWMCCAVLCCDVCRAMCTNARRSCRM